MKVHRNKCGYRGKTFEHYHGKRCTCFEGWPQAITYDTELDWSRNVNVYWTVVRNGMVLGGNCPRVSKVEEFARSLKGQHFQLWLTNNAARARELGRKYYERKGWVEPLGPGGFPLVSVARGGIRYASHFSVDAEGGVTQNVPLERTRCRIAGPYLPVGDIDWNCRTHEVDCVNAADGAIVCPVTGMDKRGIEHVVRTNAIIQMHTAALMAKLPPDLPPGSYIVDPVTGVSESVLDETRASLVASGGFCMPTEAAYNLGLHPVRPKANPDDFVWRKTASAQFGSYGKVHVATVNDRVEVALCTTTGVDGTNAAILGDRTEEQVDHEGRCKRCLHYINATGGALPPDWPKTVKATAIKKEFEMDTKARAEALRNEADKLLERAAELESRPSEPEVDDEGNAIVWFRVWFHADDERFYDYAVIRTTAGRWYSSGAERAGEGASWEQVVNHFFDRCAKVEVWQATEFASIGVK